MIDSHKCCRFQTSQTRFAYGGGRLIQLLPASGAKPWQKEICELSNYRVHLITYRLFYGKTIQAREAK